MLQKDFFQAITSKIWVEKVSTEIDQIMWNHKRQVLYVWDVERDRPVKRNNLEGVPEPVEKLNNKSYCYDTTEPDANKFPHYTYNRDAEGEMSLEISDDNTKTCSFARNEVTAHYDTSFQNLAELGSELAQIYENAYSGVETYISHCIRKTMTFNRLDFYCMGDNGKVDFSHMNAENSAKINGLIVEQLKKVPGSSLTPIVMGNNQYRYQSADNFMDAEGNVEGSGEKVTKSVTQADFVAVDAPTA